MKSAISLYIISMANLMLSCNDHNTANLAPEYLFDAGNQKVIKSIINNKEGTIAMLYGNDLALQSAYDSLQMPSAGTRYTLVTWKQKAMAQWYGTNMNGEIYSIEILKIVKRSKAKLTFDYNLQPRKGYKHDWREEKRQRINFITSQRGATFP